MKDFQIVKKTSLTKDIKIYQLYAPLVASHCQPGQFLIVMAYENGERIPLTIADFDRKKGTVEMVVQEVGKSTSYLGTKKEGDCLYAVVGPLGHASSIQGFKKIVTVGGGIGVAPVFPIARGFKENGAYTINIMGAREKNLILWEDKMKSVSDELIVCTDDGSYGRKALVTEPLKEILEKHKDVDRVLAIGPAIMMKFVTKTTLPFGVKTIVSLNSIMIDGTGMCGGCRVHVNGKTQFTCVDGPEFDAHQVDFDLLLSRQSSYREQEKASMEAWTHECQLQKSLSSK